MLSYEEERDVEKRAVTKWLLWRTAVIMLIVGMGCIFFGIVSSMTSNPVLKSVILPFLGIGIPLFTGGLILASIIKKYLEAE
jgi:hypothetical protein